MNENITDYLTSIGIELPNSSQTPQEETTEEEEIQITPATTLSNSELNELLTHHNFPIQQETEHTSEGVEAIQDAVDILNREYEEFQLTHQEETALTLDIESLERTYRRRLDFVVEHTNNIVEETLQTSDVSVAVPIAEQERVDTEEASTETETTSESLIPENPQSLLVDEATSRFSGAEWFKEIQKARIMVAGVGGIGSWLAFQLARMRPESLLLYDDDRVERVNMSGQFFGNNDVGRYKVDAIASTIKQYTISNVNAVRERFTDASQAGDIMMSGFDNMEARKLYFRAWKNHVAGKPVEERKKCLYLDGRLSIDTLQVLCITGDDDYSMRQYEERFLFSSEEAEHTVCSMKQTTYLACMIGSIMVNLFTNFIANQLNPIIPYKLPFFTEYDSQHMLFRVEG